MGKKKSASPPATPNPSKPKTASKSSKKKETKRKWKKIVFMKHHKSAQAPPCEQSTSAEPAKEPQQPQKSILKKPSTETGEKTETAEASTTTESSSSAHRLLRRRV